MTELTFKQAGTEDVYTIAQLADKIWRLHYTSIITIDQIEYMLEKMYSPDQLLKQMAAGHRFTLAYVNNQPLGYASMSITDSKSYFLHKFYVLVNEHRKGIGTELLNFILSQLNNPESIELTVNRKNYKAINFYFKNGFVIKELADFDIGNGYFMNDFVMIRNIF